LPGRKSPVFIDLQGTDGCKIVITKELPPNSSLNELAPAGGCIPAGLAGFSLLF
jgi:hypothetical protein